jgi:hypothetical protein
VQQTHIKKFAPHLVSSSSPSPPSNHLSSLPPPLSSFPALLFQPWIWPVLRYSWPLSVLYQYPHFLFGRNWIDTILDWLYLFFRSKRGPCKILYIERQEFATSCPVRSARCILSGFTNRRRLSKDFIPYFMAVHLLTTTSSGNKNQPDRTVTGTPAKATSMASASQQSPSRPSSAAPIAKNEKERAKTPGEERMNIRDTDHGSATIQPHPQGTLMALPMDSANMLNHAMRAGPPGTAPNPGFMPPQFFNPGMNMNVASQQAYGPTPPMQFYPPNYNPNAYAQAPNTVRPGSAMAKFQPMDRNSYKLRITWLTRMHLHNFKIISLEGPQIISLHPQCRRCRLRTEEVGFLATRQ